MQIAIFSIIFLLLGFLIGFVISKSRKNSYLFEELNELKNVIDEYKKQSEINSVQIKDAISTASKLTNILTTNQNLKGQFGEDCLENIIKTCFPNENINYYKQKNLENEDNKQIRPDYIVNLPNNRSLLIDCKLNLEKYLEYKEEDDINIKNSKKNELIKDLNNTINNLSNKKYDSAKNVVQPDFILMYIPLEPVITTIYTDKDFLSVIKNSIQKNIILVGNSSVLTVVRLIKLLWRQDIQEKNIENVINSAQKIYSQIAQHSNILFELKKQAEDFNSILEKEYKKFNDNGAIFKSVQELKNYGIKVETRKQGSTLNEVEIKTDF